MWYFITLGVKNEVTVVHPPLQLCRDLVRISRSWVPLINTTQILGVLVGAPLLDLKNRGCLAPMAPTLKRPLIDASLFIQFVSDVLL